MKKDEPIQPYTGFTVLTVRGSTYKERVQLKKMRFKIKMGSRNKWRPKP